MSSSAKKISRKINQAKKKANTSKLVLPTVDWRAFRYKLIAGADEVGRGCLAGPVYAAAVILDRDSDIQGLTDSKLIVPGRRKALAEVIKSKALAWAVGVASVEEIEELNILHASMLAMRRAVQSLAIEPKLVLVDGNRPMGGAWRQKTFVQGDLRCQPISAASIIAKVARDSFMEELDGRFPGYGFAAHKGYGTPVHHEALKKLGPCSFHRRTFAGVREYIAPQILAKLKGEINAPAPDLGSLVDGAIIQAGFKGPAGA